MEPEFDPSNPDTFDADASFFKFPDRFIKGFGSLESVAKRNHYMANGEDGLVHIAEFQAIGLRIYFVTRFVFSSSYNKNTIM